MAYHSSKSPKIYHNYKNCHVGDNMVEGNLEKGRPPGAKLCKICDGLRLTKKGIPGEPKLPEPYKGDVVKTYYSKERPEIFHMCQNCNVGQNIEEDNLVANEPPLVMKRKKPRLCKTCARLCIAGKCITGTPIPANV